MDNLSSHFAVTIPFTNVHSGRPPSTFTLGISENWQDFPKSKMIIFDLRSHIMLQMISLIRSGLALIVPLISKGQGSWALFSNSFILRPCGELLK